jgi:hypothetical protein
MIKLLQLLSFVVFLAVFIGSGYALVTQGGMSILWQLFWLGFVIWIWGLTLLVRLNDREKVEDSYRARDAIYYQHRYKLEKLKVAAISTLLAITFFYSSISWIFADNLIISILVLIVTFYGSYSIQSKILGPDPSEKD